jgi:hypothetical protein
MPFESQKRPIPSGPSARARNPPITAVGTNRARGVSTTSGSAPLRGTRAQAARSPARHHPRSTSARSSCPASDRGVGARVAAPPSSLAYRPGSTPERRRAYYDHLKADLELLEKFDPGATLRASRQPADPDALQPASAGQSVATARVVFERAYIESPDTCDAFVTRGVISRQGPTDATLEVTSERWETIA